MYYEEKVINGVLCARYGPDEEWIEFSKEVLTGRILNLKESLEYKENKIKTLLNDRY